MNSQAESFALVGGIDSVRSAPKLTIAWLQGTFKYVIFFFSSLFFSEKPPPALVYFLPSRRFARMSTTITSEQIEHIARLARLRFTEEKLAGFTLQFNQILEYVEKLNEVDTTGIEPMESLLETTNVLREDEPGAMLPPAEALRNAPKKTEGFFSVPKVIGEIPE